jgi:hypothetical protein
VIKVKPSPLARSPSSSPKRKLKWLVREGYTRFAHFS